MSKITTAQADKFLATCFDGVAEDISFIPIKPSDYPTNLNDLAILINNRILKLELSLVVKELKTRKALRKLQKGL